MTLIKKIRDIAARRALQRKLYAEMAAMSDAEMRDLDLSPAKIAERAHAQAFTA